jgi:hypothetical protein
MSNLNSDISRKWGRRSVSRQAGLGVLFGANIERPLSLDGIAALVGLAQIALEVSRKSIDNAVLHIYSNHHD